jgi:hypothetical protein
MGNRADWYYGHMVDHGALLLRPRTNAANVGKVTGRWMAGDGGRTADYSAADYWAADYWAADYWAADYGAAD